ncbi:putative lipoprotein NlpE involved in copper resistance [Salirhabdus euzebyi]|uniref:Putative lipoprotein NlpE involved in copper resistance n=1 Tax=Salirhabdus euzebyi TaxID=394506 RepID=A0A841Q618_9BACI|nr:hypothetical protein [Salirhabdus euzebyi]MBB6453846.1 putative lipoprotein NlpE involved in copper resistance [Salirhabdus euzebyi]
MESKRNVVLCALLLALLLTGCGNRIDVEQANKIAENYVQENESDGDEWYISQSESNAGNWVIHMKLLGNDCEIKVVYINKKSGSISDVLGGNEC